MRYIMAAITLMIIFSLALPGSANAQLLGRFEDVAELKYYRTCTVEFFVHPSDSFIPGAEEESFKEFGHKVDILAKSDISEAKITITKVPDEKTGIVILTTEDVLFDIPSGGFGAFEIEGRVARAGDKSIVDFKVDVICQGKKYSQTGNFLVKGVAEQGKGCFIATAAYGSETANELDTLRAFRDKVLLQSDPGKWFVDTYYSISPPLAEFIAEHEVVRTLVREGFLNPIVNLLKSAESRWNY